jgi:hypothetical protein
MPLRLAVYQLLFGNEHRNVRHQTELARLLYVFVTFALVVGYRLIEECHWLESRNFEPFAAAHVLAGDHVVFANHIRTRLGELRAIAFVGSRRQLALLRPDQPREFIFARLPAVRTGEGVRPLLIFLLEHLSFFH